MEELNNDQSRLTGIDEYRTTIQQLFKEGKTRQDAFASFCEVIPILKPHSAQIERLFQIMEEDKDFEKNDCIDNKHRMLAYIVLEEHMKYTHGIAVWPYRSIDDFKFYDSRYSLIIKRINVFGLPRMFVLDNFEGLERELKIEGLVQPDYEINKTTLEVINSELILLFEYCELLHSHNIYLFRLDIYGGKCTLIDTVLKQHGTIPKIINDSDNSLKFAFSWLQSNQPRIKLAQVTNSGLAIESEILLHDDVLTLYRLTGNKLQTLVSGFDPEDPNLDFYLHRYMHEPKDDKLAEVDLSVGNNYPTLRKMFNIKREGVLNSTELENATWKWLKNKCAAIGSVSSNKICIIVVDLDLQAVFTLNHYFYCFDDIVDIHLDDDYFLTLVLKHYAFSQFIVYRFPLKQPESLSNAGFFKLRREVMFTFKQSKQYRYLLSELPCTPQHLSIFAPTQQRLNDAGPGLPSTSKSDVPDKKRQKIE
ncbi:hypothetical protein M3Y97_00906800 [Aphelenchoides bicaudatus]|nr:hypothetical protein M3Y97_00906800 [Aphelenchoides bicaudatus]